MVDGSLGINLFPITNDEPEWNRPQSQVMTGITVNNFRFIDVIPSFAIRPAFNMKLKGAAP